MKAKSMVLGRKALRLLVASTMFAMPTRIPIDTYTCRPVMRWRKLGRHWGMGFEGPCKVVLMVPLFIECFCHMVTITSARKEIW